ncbi:hypothetical protein PMAYCL1PPCAC_01600, partial [Pristionchus mayeri]
SSHGRRKKYQHLNLSMSTSDFCRFYICNTGSSSRGNDAFLFIYIWAAAVLLMIGLAVKKNKKKASADVSISEKVIRFASCVFGEMESWVD